MKHWNIYLTIILMLAMLLPGCDAQEQAPTTVPTSEQMVIPTTVETEPPTQMQTVPTTEPAVESTTVPTEPEPTYPQGAVPLTQEELDGFTVMFTQSYELVDGMRPRTNWYNMVLRCFFESPEQLDLKRFFCMGVGAEEANPELSDDEIAFLETQHQINLSYDINRISAQTMDAVLRQYLGLGLEDMEGAGLEGMAYFPGTDSYYCHSGGVAYVDYPKAVDGYHTVDGYVVVFCNYHSYECMLTLKPVEDGYQILSNINLNPRDYD